MNSAQAIERLRYILRRQHKALATEDAYVFWVRRYIKAIATMDPHLPSERKVEAYLSQMARGDASASTQNQAFNAVLYFYKEVLEKPLQKVDALRAKRPAHQRHAPTVAETQLLLQTVRNVGGYPTNLIARLLYGCGLRVSEPLNLRIKDINLERRTLCIRGAKGGSDRLVVLPASLIQELTQQMHAARAVWHRDCQNRTPLMLPHRLAFKYPEYQFNWGWAWLFPAHYPCRDPRSGRIVRYRMHEANVQRAVKEARRKLGISVLPHELRHGYATHCLQRGSNPRAIQEAMGHKSLETTMGYFHAEALSVCSPLDTLPVVLPALEKSPAAHADRSATAPKQQQNNHIPITGTGTARSGPKGVWNARPFSQAACKPLGSPGTSLQARVIQPPKKTPLEPGFRCSPVVKFDGAYRSYPPVRAMQRASQGELQPDTGSP